MTRSPRLARAVAGALILAAIADWSRAAPHAAVQVRHTAAADELSRPSQPPAPLPQAFVLQVEEAHGRDAWLDHSALQFDLMLVTDHGKRLQATVLYDIANRRSRITLPNNMSFVFAGKRTWSIPPDPLPPESPAFRGWSAIVALPFLLRGDGVVCEPQGVLTIERKPMELARFTGLEIFHDEQRTDAWCIVAAEADTHLIRSAICMVNVATTDAPGQWTSRPFGFALRFDDLVTFGGVKLPTTIRLSNWSGERGIDPSTALHAQVSNLRFLELPVDAFVEPMPAPQPAPAAPPKAP